MDLSEIRQLGERAAVPQRNVQDTVVRERRHCRHGCRLLAATLSTCRHEHRRVFSGKRASRPELSRRVPECLQTNTDSVSK